MCNSILFNAVSIFSGFLGLLMLFISSGFLTLMALEFFEVEPSRKQKVCIFSFFLVMFFLFLLFLIWGFKQ